MGFPSTSKDHEFSVSGPKHLACINWKNEHHRMSVTACLVEGVYELEKDRKKKQYIPPPWFINTYRSFFHFELYELLYDDDKKHIFGAIYEYIPPPQPSDSTTDHQHHKHRRPHFVIAFRGTLMNKRDLELDFQLLRNKLHSTPRFDTAMKVVEKMVRKFGESKVWLTGHSSGAAIAMLVGKKMAENGMNLQSFIFNPPFVSIPLEMIIKSRKLELGIRVARSIIKGGLAFVGKDKTNISPFDAISAAWEPCLFVNLKDLLCCEYARYFEHRGEMEKINEAARMIEKIVTQHSLRDLIKSVDVRGLRDLIKSGAEPFYLIPSANLTVNKTPPESFKEAHHHSIHKWLKSCNEAHTINQWWKPDQDLESTVYRW